MTFFISSGVYFNKEYNALKHDEIMERKRIIEDDGYEHWSFIDSRPIQKSKIHSCHGTSLVTDREYKEVDIDSKEIKEGKNRLHVFCKIDEKDDLEIDTLMILSDTMLHLSGLGMFLCLINLYSASALIGI